MDLLGVQQTLATTIANFVRNTTKAGRAQFTRGFLRGRRECLEKYWETFQENHRQLLGEPTLQEEVYFSEDAFSAAELAYTVALGFLYDESAKEAGAQSTPEDVQPAATTRRAHLPRISLPTFSGRAEDWESFRDLFRSLIHIDPSLTGVEKLHYLKTSVQGEAKRALDGLSTTEANYTTAWSTLLKRYDDKSLLAERHMLRLAAIRPPKEESSRGLQDLLDTVTKCRDALRALDRPVDDWDAWFVLFGGQGMDSATRRDWEKKISSEGGVATYEVFKNFLHESITTLKKLEANRTSARDDTTGRRRPSASQRPGPVKALAAARLECQLCREPHPLRRCKEFEAMSVSQRRALAVRARLCYNCLQSGHAAQRCSSNHRCLKCDRQHHTMLHNPETGKRSFEDDSAGKPIASKRPRTSTETNLPRDTSA